GGASVAPATEPHVSAAPSPLALIAHDPARRTDDLHQDLGAGRAGGEAADVLDAAVIADEPAGPRVGTAELELERAAPGQALQQADARAVQHLHELVDGRPVLGHVHVEAIEAAVVRARLDLI